MKTTHNSSLSRSDGNTKPVTLTETEQAKQWKGDFGRQYTDRNTFDVDALDALYLENYGLTRTEINHEFLRDISKEASFLEVGCNTGNQLLLLQRMGYANLSGLELQPYALETARSRTRKISFTQGSALALPYRDDSFDLVFTAGVLIHIAPQDLPRALNEIHRCTRSFIWGMEYYFPSTTEVTYRGHGGLLWKMDYAQRYLGQFNDLELVRQQQIPYLKNANVDTVFLLTKKQRGA